MQYVKGSIWPQKSVSGFKRNQYASDLVYKEKINRDQNFNEEWF